MRALSLDWGFPMSAATRSALPLLLGSLLAALAPAVRAPAQAIPGDLLVAEYAAGSVVNVRGGGDFSAAARFATGLSGPRGLCVGPGGDVFVAEADSGEVTIITQGGDFTGLGSFASGLATPVALLCDDQEVLVVEAGEGSGEVTDVSAGGDFTGAPAFAAGIGDATALLRDAGGRLFASDGLGGRILDVTAGGVFLSVPPWAFGGSGSGGMAELGEARLVTDSGSGQVLDFAAGGDLTLAPVFATLPGAVSLLGVEGLGVFAASDSQDAVHEISAGGDFGAATPFATGVAVEGYAGIGHVRGCGDGILEDDGEACDDGNLSSGDGCDDECRIRLCLTPPADGCVAAAKASLSYVAKREGREKLKLTLAKFGEAVSQSDFGAPTFDLSRWDVCIYDPSETVVGQLFVDRGFQLCGPKDETCWKALGDKGYRYKDKEASASGVRAIVAVGAPKPGKGKLAVQGSNNARKDQNRLPRNLASRLEGEGAATVRVMVSDGRCYGATLSLVKKADGTRFQARTP